MLITQIEPGRNKLEDHSSVGFLRPAFVTAWRRLRFKRRRLDPTVGLVGTLAFGVCDASSNNDSRRFHAVIRLRH